MRGTAPVRNSQRQHWQAVRMARMLRHGHSSLQPVAIACTEDSALQPHVCGVKAQEGTISPRQVARKRTRGLERGAASDATHPPSCPAARHAAPTTHELKRAPSHNGRGHSAGTRTLLPQNQQAPHPAAGTECAANHAACSRMLLPRATAAQDRRTRPCSNRGAALRRPHEALCPLRTHTRRGRACVRTAS